MLDPMVDIGLNMLLLDHAMSPWPRWPKGGVARPPWWAHLASFCSFCHLLQVHKLRVQVELISDKYAHDMLYFLETEAC